MQNRNGRFRDHPEILERRQESGLSVGTVDDSAFLLERNEKADLFFFFFFEEKKTAGYLFR